MRMVTSRKGSQADKTTEFTDLESKADGRIMAECWQKLLEP